MKIERIGNLEQIKNNGRLFTVSTVKLPGDVWESMVFSGSAEYGAEVESRSATDSAQAERNHAELVKKYTPKPKPAEKPLAGKYLKLAKDLKRIHAEAVKACENVHDGGTCNMDAPALYLPRWNAAQIRKAAAFAGVGCFTWETFGSKKWVFCPRVNGQAYRREKCAEYMTEALTRAGYDALTYCAMD